MAQTIDHESVSSDLRHLFRRRILNLIPMCQHLSVSFKTYPIIEPRIFKPLNWFNFRKAYWEQFKIDLDATIYCISPCTNSFGTF